MNYSYELTGTLNHYNIKAKKFKSYDKAVRNLDNIIAESDMEVSYVISSEDSSTYILNDYSRLTISKIC